MQRILQSYVSQWPHVIAASKAMGTYRRPNGHVGEALFVRDLDGRSESALQAKGLSAGYKTWRRGSLLQ